MLMLDIINIMFTALLNRYPLVAMLIIQLAVVVIAALILTIKQPLSGFAVVVGGMAAWLPNTVFVWLTYCYHGKSNAARQISNANDLQQADEQQSTTEAEDTCCRGSSVKMNWRLAINEVAKLISGFVLLLLALINLPLTALPLVIGWLAAMAGQIISAVLVSRRQMSDRSVNGKG